MSIGTTPRIELQFGMPPVPVMRFSVDEFHQLIDAGILRSGAPVELLEGWLTKKMIKNPPHRAATRRTRLALEMIVGEGWSVDTQEPITTSDSEPEPDISVVRGDTAQLVDRHPLPEEIGLIAEVSDTSLDIDRGQKKQVYAAAQIPVYWIVNLTERCIEVYTQPSGTDFAVAEVFHPGDTIPVHLDGSKVGQIAVEQILS